MDAAALVRATRQRAEVRRYRVTASYLDPLSEEVMLPGLSALADADTAKALGMAVARDRDRVDGYVVRDRIGDLVETYFLVEDPNGNVTLRVVNGGMADLTPGVPAALEMIALDLVDSLGSRQRPAGTRTPTVRGSRGPMVSDCVGRAACHTNTWFTRWSPSALPDTRIRSDRHLVDGSPA
jgi:hypothetical protein